MTDTSYNLGIGAIAGGNKLNVAGSSNFGGTTAFQNTSTFNNNVHINSRGRLFQRADANNSLNVISTNEINFSLQSNRDADPTTGTIAIQLNDTNGITLNRATTNNLTFNSYFMTFHKRLDTDLIYNFNRKMMMLAN